MQRIVIELKILRGSLETTINKGLEQTADYADTFNAEEAHLILFNRDPNITWDEKIWQKKLDNQGRKINVWGC